MTNSRNLDMAWLRQNIRNFPKFEEQVQSKRQSEKEYQEKLGHLLPAPEILT